MDAYMDCSITEDLVFTALKESRWDSGYYVGMKDMVNYKEASSKWIAMSGLILKASDYRIEDLLEMTSDDFLEGYNCGKLRLETMQEIINKKARGE